MDYAKAKSIADRWVQTLAPHCERIKIAGSIRRNKPDVGDIEIVVEPEISKDMFGDPSDGPCAFDGFVHELMRKGLLGEQKKNGPKYKCFALPQGINLDLFIVRAPAQWGVIYTIRTGPRAFVQWMTTQRAKGGPLPSDCFVKHGAVWRDGKIVPMLEENDFFHFVEIDMVEPKDRRPNWPRSG